MKNIVGCIVAFVCLTTAHAQSAKGSATDWRTPAEISNYRTTPRYDETMAYVRRVAIAAPKQVHAENFGRTEQGRDLVAVIVSKDGVFEPSAIHRAKRPVIYIQNSIHAGEMDGKDSCLALLRDIAITKSRANLIDRAVLVIIPIYNADGHEHFGPYNRINQNGPEAMGWRTNASQKNLNRDYMKAETPETRAFLQYWNKWQPDFFVDDHVTDGADYQYDVTYFLDTDATTYPALAQWIDGLKAPLEQGVTAAGHLISPYIDFVGATPDTGINTQQSTPRFATSYINMRNRPSLLIEMHMLKDYKTRVLGNYEALRVTLELVNRDADKLLALNHEADTAAAALAEQHADFPLRMKASGEKKQVDYKGYKWTVAPSDVSGGNWVQYSNEPIDIQIPRLTGLMTTTAVKVPAAFIIPVEWTQVIDTLRAHGVAMQKTSDSWTGEVETYRCDTPKWADTPFEGHHLANVFNQDGSSKCRTVREKMTFAPGSAVVRPNQPAAKIVLHWLEPEGPDSALQWGLFDSIFEQKEYGESYVLEKLAREMLAKDPKLKAEFEQKLASDKEFAATPSARLNWFYQRSPWWDERVGLYPVGRLMSLEGVPLTQPTR